MQQNGFAGTILVSGAKNAALPELAAALLTGQPVILNSVPYLADIASMITVLSSMGVFVKLSGSRALTIEAKQIEHTCPPKHWVQKIRASILLLGPLLARTGSAKIAMPGGCAIGLRPIMEHVLGLEALGANIEIVDNVIIASAKKLIGAHIKMQSVSVGATENLIMAASLADGTTIIENAAKEPEVSDLALMLNKMGANISGYGTDTITIIGVPKLNGVEHDVMPDRIEAGTMLIAAAANCGKVKLTNCPTYALTEVIKKLTEAGAEIHMQENTITLDMHGQQPKSIAIKTAVYPGFPTDLQAQWVALLAVSAGKATVEETIFDDRLHHIPELLKMGAEIHQSDQVLTITGKPNLVGAKVKASDLRAAAGLAIAGMRATGITSVVNAHYLDRGYDGFEQKLRLCGVVLDRTVDIEAEYAN